MITISYEHTENHHELVLKGHAGYSVKGEDIYCSAVSILLYALIDTIDENWLKEPAVTLLQPGDSVVSVTAKEEFAGKLAGVFKTIMNGFRLLHEYGEKHVVFLS